MNSELTKKEKQISENSFSNVTDESFTSARKVSSSEPEDSSKISSSTPKESSKKNLTSTYNIKSIPLNIDPNPIIIKKTPNDKIQYDQSISIKFLKPVTPDPPGDIIIKQNQDIQIPPVRPLIVKQKPPIPAKPPALVLREKPPQKPVPIPEKIITIPGKVHPPPPRKIIVERLPKLPQLPRDIIIERWLGYNERFRRVVFKPAPKFIPAPAPKNLIIEWTPPEVKLDREFKLIGISKTNPSDYLAHHGELLDKNDRKPKKITKHIKAHVKAPKGVRLGVKYKPDVPKLIGDIEALKLIDLDACGLSEYKSYLNLI